MIAPNTIIALSGYPGSGKSTLRENMVDKLDAEGFYAGGIFRRMADERGLSVDVFYEKVQGDPEIEKEVDDRQAEIMRNHDSGVLVVEGRIAPFRAEEVPKVKLFLDVTLEEAARRWKEGDEDYEDKTVEEVKDIIAQRIITERRRYRELYNINDHLDKSEFDIVIDTTNLTPEEVLEEALQRIEQLQMSDFNN